LRKDDFAHLIAWAPTEEALASWSGAFFRHPLDADQLRRYLGTGDLPHAPYRTIFTAIDASSGAAVGHIELGMIRPHLSCCHSRVIVAV